jgi:hypothetical protein
MSWWTHLLLEHNAMRFPVCISILLYSLLFAGPSAADTREEIATAIDYYAEIWNEGDFEALRGYDPTFVQITPQGVEVLTQRFDEIKTLSGAGGDLGELSYHAITVKPLGDGHALAYGQLRLQFKDGSSIETWFSTVYKKTPFGWKAILTHQ